MYQVIIVHCDYTAADTSGSANMQGHATNILRKLENIIIYS